MADKTRRALGRGLDALLPTAAPPKGYEQRSVFSCAIERIVPQKGQPRRYFDKARLEELAGSIKEHGLLEPLVVRRAPGQAGAAHAGGLAGHDGTGAGPRRDRKSVV